MATGPSTRVSDVVVPEIFTPYVRQITEEKARLVQAGVLERNPLMDQRLAGGGLTFNVPSWRDLDSDSDNVSTDDVADRIDASNNNAWPGASGDSVPRKIETDTEIAIRLSRNGSWNSADLAAALAGEDALGVIGGRVGFYWMRRLQAAFIATIQGVVKDNVGSGGDGGDYGNDVAGTAFVDGVTNFSAEAYLDARVTMGDSMEDLSAIMVHSIVFNRMQKNNLIDFIPDARGEVQIATFLGAEVIVDDGMPNGTAAVRNDASAGVTGVYDTWIFGRGAVQWGVGSAKVPTEVERQASAGNGGGSETLHSRVEWSLHPVGHAFSATSPNNGGPSNNTSAGNLNNAASWNRVYPERKMIKFARLITRES